MKEAMARSEAIAAVAPFIQSCRGFRVISKSDAMRLLGEERFQRLTNDPVRGKGPAGSGSFYFWNVADYLQFPELRVSNPAACG